MLSSWGGALYESDYVMDFIAGKMSDDLRINMNFINNPAHYHCTHKTQSKSTRNTRRYLNKGHLTRVFDQYKSVDKVTDGLTGAHACMVVAAKAMFVGATISAKQLEFLRSNYKTCGLHREGIEQMEKALKDYVNGTPYELVEPVRDDANIHFAFNMARADVLRSKKVKDAPFLHTGPRYYQDKVPSWDPIPAERRKKRIFEKKEPAYFPGAPVLRECATCGKLHDQADVSLKGCAGCKKVMYCDKECQKKDWAHHKKFCRVFAAMPAPPAVESLQKSPMCVPGFDPLAKGAPADRPHGEGPTLYTTRYEIPDGAPNSDGPDQRSLSSISPAAQCPTQ